MKKIISLICALMVVSGMALAQRGEPVVIPLWPNGFRPNGTVIIACPGGGNKLNNRPRNRLGYLTPNEKFNSILTN